MHSMRKTKRGWEVFFDLPLDGYAPTVIATYPTANEAARAVNTLNGGQTEFVHVLFDRLD
jgi:hypothetical protein